MPEMFELGTHSAMTHMNCDSDHDDPEHVQEELLREKAHLRRSNGNKEIAIMWYLA